MITPDELRALTQRADQTYVLIFCAALLLCWLLFLGWRSARLRTALTAIRLPLPSLSLSAILFIGLVVRLPRLFDSLWYDESFTARLVGLPSPQIFGAIMGDVHPPLWYALESLWTHLVGNSEFALRFPSLVFGLLLVWLVYRLAHALQVGEEAALLAALLVAVLPAQSYYSAEARGYALLACLAISMMLAIRQNRPLVFGFCGVLMCWTHNLGFFYLGILGLYAVYFWWYRGPRWERYEKMHPRTGMTTYLRTHPLVDWLCLLRWLILPGLIAALWLPFALTQAHAVADGFWLQSIQPGGVLEALTDVTIGRRLPEVFVLPVFIVVWGLTLAGLWQMRRRLFRTPTGTLLLCLLVGVPLTIALVSILWRPIYLTRALLPLGGVLALVWARMLVHAPARGFARLVAVPVLAIGLVCSYFPDTQRADIRGFLRPCSDVTAAYATSIPAAMLTSYYVHAPLTVWADAGDLNQTLTPEAKASFGLVSGRVDDLLTGPVCFLTLNTPMTTDAERAHVAATLAAHPHTTNLYPVNSLFEVSVYVLEGEPPHALAQSHSSSESPDHLRASDSGLRRRPRHGLGGRLAGV